MSETAYREEADEALRELLFLARATLHEGEVDGQPASRAETEGGATILRAGGVIIVEADFVTDRGTDENLTVTLPAEGDNLDEVSVGVEWTNPNASNPNRRSGVNTPKVRDHATIARELIALF